MEASVGGGVERNIVPVKQQESFNQLKAKGRPIVKVQPVVNVQPVNKTNELAFYINVYLELEKGDALSPEQMKQLRCKKVWSSIQKSYSDLIGGALEEEEIEEKEEVEEEGEVEEEEEALKPQQQGDKKRNKKYKHLFRY
jgi:hypothetical protein